MNRRVTILDRYYVKQSLHVFVLKVPTFFFKSDSIYPCGRVQTPR